VTEDGAAVLLNMFNQAQAMPRALKKGDQRILTRLDGMTAKIAAVELHQIKGVQERAVIVAAATQHLEVGQTVVIGHHDLAVDQAGPTAQRRHRINDHRVACGPVVTPPRVHTRAAARLPARLLRSFQIDRRASFLAA